MMPLCNPWGIKLLLENQKLLLVFFQLGESVTEVNLNRSLQASGGGYGVARFLIQFGQESKGG